MLPTYASPIERIWYWGFRIFCVLILIFLVSPLLVLVGVVTLGAGYWMAVSITNPVEALMFFFVAVVLVIIGTYCLFTAGSIATSQAEARSGESVARIRSSMTWSSASVRFGSWWKRRSFSTPQRCAALMANS